MKAKELRDDLFQILGFVEEQKVFREMTEALRALQRANAGSKVILVQSWEDEIEIADERALLFMVRSKNLFRNQFLDEAQKYESLAVKYSRGLPDSN